VARWQLDQGSGDSWDVPAVDSNGDPIAYTGAELLSAKIWPGGLRAGLITLTPTWKTPASGITNLVITGVQTATLVPAIYRVVCTLTDAGGAHDYYRGDLEIFADPGTEIVAPAYCTVADLRDHAAWIDDLQAESDQAGFARQLGKARKWLDDLIVNRFKVQSSGALLPGQPGYGAYSLGMGDDMPPSKWLRDQLDANLLIVRESTVELCALRALWLICSAQVGRDPDGPYQKLARGFLLRADNLAKTYRAEIDPDGSGYPSITVNLGQTNLR
jgi:hypothetical protein